MQTYRSPAVTGVILSGGEARRMGGQDKGLLPFRGQALVQHVIRALAPQVDAICINANRHLDRYAALGCPVITDSLAGFQGPLSGMLSALQSCSTDTVLCVPCDAPNPPHNLRQRLMEAMIAHQADVAVVEIDGALQPVFCLIKRTLATDLATYLDAGHRRVEDWFMRHNCVRVDFSDMRTHFVNLNEPQALTAHARDGIRTFPILGFAAYSGTGKTTLLSQLLPMLKARGWNLGVLKHAHHRFDIDKPGKDSYRLRAAGANPLVIASAHLLALMATQSDAAEPDLDVCLQHFAAHRVDGVLVEGFKQAALPKIELHRAALGHPLLYPQDPHIIALATDTPLSVPPHIAALDLNQIDTIADFVCEILAQQRVSHVHI